MFYFVTPNEKSTPVETGGPGCVYILSSGNEGVYENKSVFLFFLSNLKKLEFCSIC